VFWPVTNNKLGRNIIYNSETLYVTTKFMICYLSGRCILRPSLLFVTGQNTMLRPSLWFVTGQNTVWYDQVYDLLPIKTLYATTKFMICYWSQHYATTKFMICYWSKDYATTKFMIWYPSKHCRLWPSLWFVKLGRSIVFWPVTNYKLGRRIQRSDQ
jgi:hypothetical protein